MARDYRRILVGPKQNLKAAFKVVVQRERKQIVISPSLKYQGMQHVTRHGQMIHSTNYDGNPNLRRMYECERPSLDNLVEVELLALYQVSPVILNRASAPTKLISDKNIWIGDLPTMINLYFLIGPRKKLASEVLRVNDKEDYSVFFFDFFSWRLLLIRESIPLVSQVAIGSATGMYWKLSRNNGLGPIEYHHIGYLGI